MNFIERKLLEAEMTKWLKAHWGLIASTAGGLIVFLTPSLEHYEAANPKTTLTVIIAVLLKVAQEEKLLGITTEKK